MFRVWLLDWPFVVTLQYITLACLRVPRICWSFIGLRDMPRILCALSTSAVLMLGLRYGSGLFADSAPVLKNVMIPSSVILIDLCLSVLGITGVRGARRLFRERRQRARRRPAPQRIAAVLIGAGDGGRMLAQELNDRAELGIDAVAFADDNPNMLGRTVAGLRVAGTTADLAAIAGKHGARTALIAIASADAGSMHRIVRQCETAGLATKIIPQLDEIVSGKCRISQLRDVAIEDLLGRAAVRLGNREAAVAVTGKSVMVTGAGGSIGSELCRQIVQLSPATLVLVERSENSLYQIHRELAALPGLHRIVPALADICDARRMAELFERHRPHVVFHAAAHKHVPMMEYNPGEAIRNNVFGTKIVADLADRWQSERFVLVSTDKAVNPTSVMGATKRLAELYVQHLDARSEVRFAAVRFGNVAGSAGSVIPLFREQIARGGPVTVTHPEMKRFFMTIAEASRLVLEASGLSDGGEVMMLDMGEPVMIRSLAEQMIRLSGFEPGVDIEIRYTGIRPGEKLSEELSLQEEQVEPTRVPKLFVLRGSGSPVDMDAVLAALVDPGRSADEVRTTLHRVLPMYRAVAATDGARRDAAATALPIR